MKHLMWVTALAVVFGLAACSQQPEGAGDDHAGHDHGAMSEREAGEEAVAGDTAAAGAKEYPLEVCIVSGEELGSMGEPHVIVHEGQEVKFCCKDCVSEFEAKPAEYLVKIENAQTEK